MFRRKGIRISVAKTFILGTSLLACLSTAFAQHGGHGGSLGGGGLNGGGGRPSGVDTKDDLKDFHQALAVQASSQQIIEFKSMVKSTAEASAELRSLLEQLERKDSASAVANRGATVEQALQKARDENKNFLGGFSGPQKSGLKEITKRLTKADSELAQRTGELHERVADAKAISEQGASSAQSLEQALTIFQSQQASLGQEMGIVDSDSQDVTFEIAPVKNTVHFAEQSVAIITSGAISKSAARVGVEDGQNSFTLNLTEDISDLQQNITEVLRAQLDKAERCGERVAIQNATLTPLEPASLVVVQLHFERWSCRGRDNNEIAEGDGSMEMKLTAAVAEDGTLRLIPAMGLINAEGLLRESLRSGSLGDELRDKITESILSAVRQGGDFKVMLPPAAQGYAALHHAQFRGTGSGQLVVVLDGDIKVSNEKATSLTSELKARSSLPQSLRR